MHVNHRRSELRECNCCLPSSARSVKKKRGFDLLVFIALVGTLSPRGKNSMFKFSLNISFGFIFVFESVTVICHKYFVEKSFAPGVGGGLLGTPVGPLPIQLIPNCIERVRDKEKG